MKRRPPVLLPDEVLPWDPKDEGAAAARQRRMARKAGISMSLMGLVSIFIQLFKPTAKPIVFEQHQPGNADPLERDPEAGRFGGRVRLPPG